MEELKVTISLDEYRDLVKSKSILEAATRTISHSKYGPDRDVLSAVTNMDLTYKEVNTVE